MTPERTFAAPNLSSPTSASSSPPFGDWPQHSASSPLRDTFGGCTLQDGPGGVPSVARRRGHGAGDE